MPELTKINMANAVKPHTLFSKFDVDLFKAGKHYRLYEKFGAHIMQLDGEDGVYFAVWAPAAKKVSVIGDFNDWQDETHELFVRWDSSGIWEGFIPNVGKGSKYKYKIHSNSYSVYTEKADPFGAFCETPPRTASLVWEHNNYEWNDATWVNTRKEHNSLDKPFAVYEVHLGSWKRKNNNKFLSYKDLAEDLVNYVTEMNFTHVEFMPVMEYPYDPSWGYQITGYFAPTSRFGNPEDFKYLVDKLHQNNIGVILDWVPSHFPEDAHGLGNFDGSNLYEHPDKRKGYHPDWKSLIFNYERNEVRSFLISNALFWIDKYHADGLRVDAVASILYLDYSREDGEWEANEFGGRENLAAISFLKELNKEVYVSFEGVQTIAEESTSFSMVSRPTSMGGLGFGMKWMMGWMHDTLEYFKRDSVYRRYHHNEISFAMTYAFTENFMLPLSHDEVVYGKNPLIYKMPGDEWQRFANLRLLFGYMYTHPGAKLLFMGGEFGQTAEWNFQQSLDWHLTQYPVHKGVQELVKDLNLFYKSNTALYEKQFENDGFEWIAYDDSENSVYSYIRKGKEDDDMIIVVCNMIPSVHQHYKIGVPTKGKLKEIFNTDLEKYNGSNTSNSKPITIKKGMWNGRPHHAEITIPPLTMVAFKIV
ncbi:1,4-alpha-glucan branching protein GlgB [Zhouia sp. PK063]|uniref:1,4-alpha-glucan branching protein GlgB n=1 Tax=Zhouia sp. PK063 TaxID=3373602 RepID=UPI00379426DB